MVLNMLNKRLSKKSKLLKTNAFVDLKSMTQIGVTEFKVINCPPAKKRIDQINVSVQLMAGLAYDLGKSNQWQAKISVQKTTLPG